MTQMFASTWARHHAVLSTLGLRELPKMLEPSFDDSYGVMSSKGPKHPKCCIEVDKVTIDEKRLEHATDSIQYKSLQVGQKSRLK